MEPSKPQPPTSSRLTRSLAAIGIGYVVIACFFGIASGIGLFTFGYGQGASYLSNNPQACVNCHVMQEHYDSWQNSSHHHTAACNDCHLSHHPIGKWVTKADNGFFHSLAFTTGDYPKPIRIKPRNRRVTQNACIHCHDEIAHDTHFIDAEQRGSDAMTCMHCHTDVGHSFR